MGANALFWVEINTYTYKTFVCFVISYVNETYTITPHVFAMPIAHGFSAECR